MQKKATRIVFFGDSITRMGVDLKGYITMIQKHLYDTGNTKIELLEAGVGGDKIYDLYLRVGKDVLEKKPDRVVVFEGVNDVRHKTIGTGMDLIKYEKFYRAVIIKLQEQVSELILVTPACIGELKNGANPQDEDLELYCDVIRRLAIEYQLRLLDFRKRVLEYGAIHNEQNAASGLLTTDQVHLSDSGNQLLADELIDILEL